MIFPHYHQLDTMFDAELINVQLSILQNEQQIIELQTQQETEIRELIDALFHNLLIQSVPCFLTNSISSTACYIFLYMCNNRICRTPAEQRTKAKLFLCNFSEKIIVFFIRIFVRCNVEKSIFVANPPQVENIEVCPFLDGFIF